MQKNNNHDDYDFKIIANLIREGSKVLDIGCSEGKLMWYLREFRNIDVKGLDDSYINVNKALKLGLEVRFMEINGDFPYDDLAFDYAILNNKINEFKNVRLVIEEALRVANRVVVVFENFAYLGNRLDFLLCGGFNMPKFTKFHQSNNFSIKDFSSLCAKMDWVVVKKIFLTKGKLKIGEGIANLFAKNAIFVISKKDLAGADEVVFSDVNDFNKQILLPN